MRAVKSVSIDSERRVIITFLDGSTETLYPNCIWCDAEALKEIIKELLEEKADAVVQTINDVAVATFADGADEALIRKLLVSIDPIQEGTGDPSPDNVRPISGRTGLTVYRSGSDTSDPTEFHVTWETEAGTVYGGSLDVASGKLMIDRAGNVYDGSSDENWSRYGTGSASAFAMRINVTGMKEGTPTSSIVISNELKSLASNTPWGSYDSFISTQSGSAVLVVGIKTITTVADWRAYLTSSPLQVVYELATPTEIQLNPQEITTLLGDNSIWADSGNILELEYVADTKLYIGESQSGTLGSGRQTITKPDLQPVSEKTVEDLTEEVKAETDEKETQVETEDERGE